MKQGLCEIIVVSDRSGSMGAIKNDAIGAFNNFLQEQKKLPGECLITYAQFDDTYETLAIGKPLQEFKELTEATYQPRGSTALLDAVGRTIDEVGARLNATPEKDRPERVLMAILTDGHENASKDYTRIQIFDRIKHQREKYKWQFIFLAAGQDAFDEAVHMGIPKMDIFHYAASDALAHGTAVKRLSSRTADYRSGKDTVNP